MGKKAPRLLSQAELDELVAQRLAERNAPRKPLPKVTMSYRSAEAVIRRR